MMVMLIVMMMVMMMMAICKARQCSVSMRSLLVASGGGGGQGGGGGGSLNLETQSVCRHRLKDCTEDELVFSAGLVAGSSTGLGLRSRISEHRSVC